MVNREGVIRLVPRNPDAVEFTAFALLIGALLLALAAPVRAAAVPAPVPSRT